MTEERLLRKYSHDVIPYPGCDEPRRIRLARFYDSRVKRR